MPNPLPTSYEFLTLFLVAAIACAVFVLFFVRSAERWGLMDRPGGRKQHEAATPVVGGIAMGVAFFVGMVWFFPLKDGQAYFLLGVAMLLLLGVVDDLKDLAARRKIMLQVVAVLVMIVPNAIYLSHLGDLVGLGRVELGLFAIPFTVFATVGLINAVNMSDGIDGAAGGLVATSSLWLLILALAGGRSDLVQELLLFFGVTVGFLCFNMRTPLRSCAAVFMGDAGSMMLGAMLAWYSVHITQMQLSGGALPPIVILWILGLPVLDTVVLMLRRIRQGRSPFSAGRDHMHHIWTHAGFSVGQTTAILMTVQALLGAAGVLGWRAGVPEWGLTAGYLALVLIHRSLASHAWQVSKWLRLHRPQLPKYDGRKA